MLGGEQPIAVRPHPHIGLATVTYLWEGSMMHRDSLGSVQEIQPGDVNWMTAGRGIAHSERTPERLRGIDHPFHGLQTWVALPREHEDAEPSFAHHPKATLPVIARPRRRNDRGCRPRVRPRSPVQVLCDTLYVSIDLAAGCDAADSGGAHRTRALSGQRRIATRWRIVAAEHAGLLDPGSEPMLHAASAARVMLLGGEPAGRPTHRLVELRRQQSRAHRAGQVRLAGRPLRRRPRRNRIHPAPRSESRSYDYFGASLATTKSASTSRPSANFRFTVTRSPTFN